MTWPLILRLNSHLAGRDYDVWLNPWATWWTEKVLAEGQSLYYTDSMFYPYGVSLTFHSFSHMNSGLELLLRPWLGNLGSYNGTIILAHLLSGYGMFCLVRYIKRDLKGAFFAGLVFAFFPYRMSESVHLHLVSTQWMPLYFLFFLRLLREGQERHVVPAALFFLLNALCGWHLMLFALFLSVLYLGYALILERERQSRITARNLALLAGLVGMLLIPFLYPLLREQLTVARSYVGVDLGTGQGNDLLAFLLPAQEHPIWGGLVHSTRPAYLGVTALGLGLAGSLIDWRRARFWVLLASASALLSLGPYLQIGGHDLGILVPWSVPTIWLARHSFRFNLLLGFALAVTSGLGLSAVLQRLAVHRAGWRWPFAGAMMALLSFEYLYLPFPTTEVSVPDFYHDLAAQPGQGAILDLPMGRQPAKRYMYYQTTHGRPLVEGHVSRTPAEAYAFIDETPVLHSLRACASEWLSPGPYLQVDSPVWALPPIDLSAVLNALAEHGIEYVILHKDWATPASVDAWLSVRELAPDYEDEQIAAYRTQRNGLSPLGQAQLLDDCIAVRPALAGPIPALQGETVNIALEWTAGGWPQDAYILELALVDAEGEMTGRHRYQVTPGLPATAWELGSQQQGVYPFPVPPSLPPGAYRLQATLVPVEQEKEALLAAQLLDVRVSARPGNYEPIEQTVNRTFEPALSLLGYDLEADSGAMHLTLHWRALQQIETDYKFFVHLYEAESETIVAQMDVMPYNWTYPTSWWEEGEMVSDEITIPLDDVPPGTYRLAVGVYDPVTGIRLPVRDAEGAFEPLDRLVLQQVQK